MNISQKSLAAYHRMLILAHENVLDEELIVMIGIKFGVDAMEIVKEKKLSWIKKDKKDLECNPTGRITYRELRELLFQMSEEQLDCDVTIEDPMHDPNDPECYAGELTICGEEHGSLDDFHPTIRLLADKDDSNIDEAINKDGDGE